MFFWTQGAALTHGNELVGQEGERSSSQAASGLSLQSGNSKKVILGPGEFHPSICCNHNIFLT